MAKNDRVLLDGIIDERVHQRLPSDKRDEAFEYLTFEQILKDLDLSPEEIGSGSIDGRQDAGIDGFFILVNGHLLQDPESFFWPRTGSELQVFVITCKHHDTFKQATLDNLAASLTELLNFGLADQELKGAYSDSVLKHRNNLKYAYRKVSPRLSSFAFNVVYASRGDTSDIGDEVRSRADQIRSIVDESFGTCKSNFQFIGSAELVDLHRRMPNYSLELKFAKALSSGERYVLLAKLSDYYNFISDNRKLRRYLFDSNVRDFMGLNRVNEDIRNTLSADDDVDFWWLNNGITMLANSARIVGDLIQMQDIQIVNGLQTTESIFRHFESGGGDPHERSVLVKVVVSKDEAVRDAIIRATNNQTMVELASLHATDKIQRDIEDILYRNGLYYERRKNYYVNLGYSPKDIVTPLYLAAGYLSLVLKHPHKAPLLKSKFMRLPSTHNEIFSLQAPIEIWPKIAAVLKITDRNLEEVRLKGFGSERFLKGWRYIVSYCVISKLLGKLDFSVQELINLDIDQYTDQRVSDAWYWLNANFHVDNRSGKWSSRINVIAALHALEEEFGLTGFNSAASRISLDTSSSRRTGKETMTEDFVNHVKELLPPQPWKPGMHRDVINKLGCTQGLYNEAIEALVDDGRVYKQEKGVLYDLEGNVVGFDSERVDPDTMEPRSS